MKYRTATMIALALGAGNHLRRGNLATLASRARQRNHRRHGMTKRPQVPVLALALALALVGCEEAMDLPETGDSGTVRAPTTVIDRVLVIYFNGEVIVGSLECQAGKHNPRTARLWFVNQSKIRGVRDDATFDQPTIRWTYERTSVRSGTISLWWANGFYDEFHLTFADDSSGSFRAYGTKPYPDSCGHTETRVTGEFEIEDPP